MNLSIFLNTLTGSNWHSIDGPDSGTGIDYWFADDAGKEAYVNIDQTALTISVNGEVIYSGNISDIETHEDILNEFSEQGWNDSTKLALLLRYLDQANISSAVPENDFRDYLKEFAEAEECRMDK